MFNFLGAVDPTGANETLHKKWQYRTQCLTKRTKAMKYWIEINQKYDRLLGKILNYPNSQIRIQSMCCAAFGIMAEAGRLFNQTECTEGSKQFFTSIEIVSVIKFSLA